MRIGVDAHLLCRPITGIGRSLIEIGKRLSSLNPDIIFYTPAKTDFDSLLNIRSSSNKKSLLGQKFYEHFWAQTLLPLHAMSDRIDVFWGPAHRLPLLLPKSIVQVLTIHDLVWISHPKTMKSFSLLLEKICMPYSLAHANRIMAISNSTQQEILQEFPKVESKLSVISLGPTSFPIKQDLKIFDRLNINHKYILFVGTVEPRKNLTRLIEAYSKLSLDLKSQYDLVLVGSDGWGNLNLPNWIKLYGLSESIKIVGYVSDEDLASLYCHAAFLAMPSLSEGFGLPIVEAMRAGIPILTSNCSSMPEIAGDAALFVDPLSVDSILNGLERMLLDSQLRKTLSLNSYKNSKKYSWDKCASDLMNLFEDAFSSHGIKNFESPSFL